jgi:4-hydroxybenzoate polyprenyltransferase
MVYTEEDLRLACLAARRKPGIKRIAREHGVPPSTLRRRLNGILPKPTAHAHEMRLSPELETDLAQFVRLQAALGSPLTHEMIRELAQRICVEAGDDRRIGKGWCAAFLRRNPVLKTQRSRRINSARVNNATKEVIRPWFNYLRLPQVRAIKPANRYNIDETGIIEGITDNGLVVEAAEKRSEQKKNPGSHAWTSILEGISALGKVLPPLIIFRGKNVQAQWFEEDLKAYGDWEFVTTEKGWTNSAVCLEWLEKVFLPLTAPEDPSERRLLILDGHDSHTTVDFMWQCFKNKVHLLYLPPHTTHVLQPLDLAIFSVLKRAYRRLLNMQVHLGLRESTIVGKRMMLRCYYQARLETITEANCKAGWKASGLWPVNMSKPLMSRNLIQKPGQPKGTRPSKAAATGLPPPVSPTKATQANYGVVDPKISTPKGAKDLGRQLRSTIKPNRTTRILFSKVEKAFGQKNYHIATLKREVESLKAQLDNLKPLKRKKVVVDPNRLFANIKNIVKAKKKAGHPVVELSSSEESEESSSEEEDCIVVGSGGRN